MRQVPLAPRLRKIAEQRRSLRLADYIAEALVRAGVRQVFMVTGGGAMHLNDAIGRHPGLQYVCNHHEQACAMAAEGYYRATGRLPLICVTTGPGGTNALTGVLGQWLDSIPALVISGQVRSELMAASTGLPLRQLGDQEADIVAMVRPITKYAEVVSDPAMIQYHLEKALSLCRGGRPGPVWLDIPLDVQAATIDPAQLMPGPLDVDDSPVEPMAIEPLAAEVLRRIAAAQRPVILAGAGIRLAGAEEAFHAVANRLNVPLQAAWNAIDLIPSDHPLYVGRPSTLGQRAANFIFQNADLLLSIGCRLNTRQIGYHFASVGRAAYKIAVDVDPAELAKATFQADLPICCDAKRFLEAIGRQLTPPALPPKAPWIAWCQARCERYPLVLPEHRRQRDGVNPYLFCETLGDCLAADDVVVSSDGSSCVVPIQTLRIRTGQRHIVNSGCAAMGYGLPAALGACVGLAKRRVICLEGDGSIQLNIQELQTLVHYQLPVKIFVFSNGGYLSIRTTQKSFFDGHLVGEGPQSGVSFPDLVKLAEAYGLRAMRIAAHEGMAEAIAHALALPGPVLCDVCMSPSQEFVPRVSSQRLPNGQMRSKPLEDMYPFLDQEEFLSNMIIPPLPSG